MESNITYEICPNCKETLSEEEIKNQECWICGWPKPMYVQPGDNIEWDIDDDEAMPNVLRQYPGGII